MSKLLGFGFLWYLFGNPIVALLVLLLILYLVDQRFIGMLPSLLRPWKMNRRMSQLKQELRLNPHFTSGKLELARLLIEKKKYEEAQKLLEDAKVRMEDSADLHAELGLCYLKQGDIERGEAMMKQALDLNPRVKYGEPYLRLAEAYMDATPKTALHYLDQFRTVNSSSCEAYYRLGQLYEKLGQQEEAKQAYRETKQLYRSLPRYSRRLQRKWAILARLKG